MQEVLAQLPWYHQLALLDKLSDPETRRWYAAKAIKQNWSRNVLVMQIETRLLERSGTAVTNFDASLPKPQSDLARESVKDPYRFDFLGLTDEAQERDIEHALVKHVTEFLLESAACRTLCAGRVGAKRGWMLGAARRQWRAHCQALQRRRHPVWLQPFGPGVNAAHRVVAPPRLGPAQASATRLALHPNAPPSRPRPKSDRLPSAGFAFVGRQVLLDVGGDEFFIDLLFYHLKLRCYVVIELKGGKFKPEHLGQLGFYLTAMDRQVKGEHDNPSIGLLLCKRQKQDRGRICLGR